MVVVSEALVQELRGQVRGTVLAHEPMARHTSLRIGGPADLLVTPEDAEDLAAVLAFARSTGLPVHVCGGGSNTLVRDGGLRGIVLQLTTFQHLGREGVEVSAGAGVRVSRLLAFCSRVGLGGLEMLSGVPGTVGGAVWGNAGAWGGAVADRLVRLRLLTREGEAQTLHREAVSFEYRRAGLPPGSVVTEATFGLEPGDPTAIRQRISRWLIQRNARQPVEFRSAGSIFKNPPGDHAGRLVDLAGLKGSQVGGAKISEKHGNFFVNLGDARAADILALIEMARARVKAQSGIDLELEVRVVGED
jgi:UDP-N-acetylmuramate dehydrogenase